MRFGRKRASDAPDTHDAAEAHQAHDPADPAGPADPADPAGASGTGRAGGASPAAPKDPARANGPWDLDEVPDLELGDGTDPEAAGRVGRIDLGSIVVQPVEGVDVQLQVDEQSGDPRAVLLTAPEGAVELRAFAAPRHGEVWDEVREELSAEVVRRGGTATEAEGHWGTELRVVLPVTTPEGQQATQPSRVLGIAGPRWLLRATLFGRTALEPTDSDPVLAALREVVVRRGGQPHAPGDALPMRLPPQAVRRDDRPDDG